ncbi:MAG TPA: cytochrome P450 [Gaiellaceae bacterium]|nr:cytochrome P450 [Gaiellaceae bacterium]
MISVSASSVSVRASTATPARSWGEAGQLSLLRYWRNPERTLHRLSARQGELALFRLGRQRVAYLSGAELIERVLIGEGKSVDKTGLISRWWRERVPLYHYGASVDTHDREQHRAVRRALNPPLSLDRAEADVPLMATTVARLCQEQYERGGQFDLLAFAGMLTSACFLRSLCEREPDLAELERLVGLRLKATSRALPIRAPSSPLYDLWDILRDLVSHPRRIPDDIRAQLLELVEDLFPAAASSLQAHMERATAFTPPRLATTDEAVERLLGLIAGDLQASGVLLYCSLLGVQARELGDALAAEVPVGALDGPRLHRLELAKGAVMEGARLTAPFLLIRVCHQPFAVDGLPIEPGDLLFASPYLLHRDPGLWPEPECFRPERWHGEEAAARPRRAFLTFGGGIRQCGGRRHVLTAATTALATLERHWRLDLDGELSDVAFKPPPRSIEPSPDRRLQARLVPRHSSSRAPETLEERPR